LNDPDYNIDLQYVMCANCVNNLPGRCIRREGDNPVKLVIASRAARERTRRPPSEFVQGAVFATGCRLTKAKKKPIEIEKKVRKKRRSSTGLVFNSVTTPSSKHNQRTMYRMQKEVEVTVMQKLKKKCPNMTDDGRRRMVSVVFDKKARAANKQGDKGLKSRSGCGQSESGQSEIVTREMQANAFNGMMPFLRTASLREQRPILAAMTKQMNRKSAQRVCRMNISRRQWCHARNHYIFPGPFKAVQKVKVSRHQMPKGSVEDIVGFLTANSLLQRHAVGASNHTYANGEEQMFDSVSLTKTLPVILRDYGKHVESFIKHENIQVPQDSNRCTKRCPKMHIRCMKEKDHDKGESKCRCQFTPSQLLSPSSVVKFVSATANGSLKNLAGLDDEDVIKGHDNFRRLIEIARMLCIRLQKPKAEQDKLIDEIEKCKVFHDTTFVGHVHDHAERSCQCRACGFTSPQEAATKGKKLHVNHVYCQHRENNSHTGRCNDCETSFEMFSTLFRLAKEAEKLPNATTSEREDFYEIGNELVTRRQNLIGLRSHKVRKKVESDFDRKQTQTLGPDECIIISDFKMKILAMYFRENMRLFYGKRGISCLGFMVIKACDEDDKVDVHFYLFFSNDTTQDNQ
jgi:hypothetical protein